MNLVILDSQSAYDSAMEFLRSHEWTATNVYWTDGISLNGNGNFIWETTGQTVRQFYPIGSGEPNGTGNCIAIQENRGRIMSDESCSTTSVSSGFCEGPTPMPRICPVSIM